MNDDELARRLSVSLALLSRRLRPERGELSMGHFSTLALLDREGPQRVGDLARAERVSAPVMTRIVGVLDGRGLVVREPGPHDGRVVQVAITGAGAALVAEVRAERAAAVAELLAALEPDQRAALAGALEALEALATRASPAVVGA